MSTHGNHSSQHSSHSSQHSSYTSLHSNTSGSVSSNDSVTSTPAWSGYTPSTSVHTVTATQVASSLSTGNKVSTLPSASGSLTALVGIANQARATITSPNSAYTVTAKQITPADFRSVVNSAGGTQGPFYALGTISHNATAQLKKTGSNSGTVASGSASASLSNSTMTNNAGTLASETLSVKSVKGTTTSVSSGAVSFPSVYSATINPNMGLPTQGDKLSLSDALSRIKKMSSSVSNFGTYKWSGTYEVTHASHTSHSSSHSSHSSNHTSHSSSHTSHSSSLRIMKTKIEPYTQSALDILKQIKIVEFFYKDNYKDLLIADDPTIKHIGFIADDSPEEVATQYHDRLDYMNCIGLLIKAVQELTEQVTELKKNINI